MTLHIPSNTWYLYCVLYTAIGEKDPTSLLLQALEKETIELVDFYAGTKRIIGISDVTLADILMPNGS